MLMAEAPSACLPKHQNLAGSASDQTVTMTGMLTGVSTAAMELAAIGDEDSQRDGKIGSIENNIKGPAWLAGPVE